MPCTMIFLENDTATSRAAYTGVSFPGVLGFGSLGVFFVDNLLGFDSHVDHVGCITIEFRY